MEERGFSLFAPDEDVPGKDSEVFFNREMKKNRDISKIAGEVFSGKIETEEFRSCDALSGSGIRGLRYSDFSDRVWLNDANPEAVEACERALEQNGVEAEVSNLDANIFLSQNRNFFHLIDVDPFGSFIPYLDSAVRASNHQSLAGFTATDNAVPSGSYSKTCLRKYGSKPLKNSFMHETGLRIYIHEVFRNYARHDKCFDPKVCWHERHYSRIVGRVTESKKRTNRALQNVGKLSFCPECRWRKLERKRKCGNCDNTDLNIAGPLWTGKLSDQRFTSEMLDEMPDEWEDSRQLLSRIDSEAEILTPFYDLHELCSSMGIQVPKRDEVIGEIREKGYPVSRTHFSNTGFRTDAPLKDIKNIVKRVN